MTRLLLLAAVLALAPAAQADSHAGDPRGRFDLADRNGDGKLDRSEFQAHQMDIFYFVDRDKSGKLTAQELGVSPERAAAADLDGDGLLSMEEFLEARAKDFDAADTNDDGVLTRAEIDAYVQARP